MNLRHTGVYVKAQQCIHVEVDTKILSRRCGVIHAVINDYAEKVGRDKGNSTGRMFRAICSENYVIFVQLVNLT